MKSIFELLEILNGCPAPSGREDAAHKTIEALIKPYADEIKTDPFGNLIIHKKGTGKKLMLCAHLDTIGFIATYIDDKGFVRIGAVGGIEKQDSINRPVIFKNGTKGILSKEEKAELKDATLSDFFIDLGIQSKEEAEKLVTLGDIALFDGKPENMGSGVTSPYLDNRLGVALLLRTLMKNIESKHDLYIVLSAQEEVGLRGAKSAAYSIQPNYAIAIDVTDCGGTPGQKEKLPVCIGNGAAIKLMDRAVLTSKEITAQLEALAAKNNIKAQREIFLAGGTDAGAIQSSRGGVLTGAISIPARYVHSPAEFAAWADIEAAETLLEALIRTGITEIK